MRRVRRSIKREREKESEREIDRDLNQQQKHPEKNNVCCEMCAGNVLQIETRIYSPEGMQRRKM